MMNSDLDQLLHKLVVAALTVFVVVSLCLAAFVGRELWLQQRMVGLSSSLQSNLEQLEETTEEIQDKMSEIESTNERAPQVQEWDNVNDLLENVDQQLASIEDNIDEVAVASSPEIDLTTLTNPESQDLEPITTIRGQADQVFTIFAVLTGIAAVAIALLLGMAMRVQDNHQVSSEERRGLMPLTD